MFRLRYSCPNAVGGPEDRTAQIIHEKAVYTRIVRAVLYQVVVGFFRIGKEFVFNSEETYDHKCIEEGAQLGYVDANCIGDFGRTQRAILEWRKQVKLHSCQYDEGAKD